MDSQFFPIDLIHKRGLHCTLCGKHLLPRSRGVALALLLLDVAHLWRSTTFLRARNLTHRCASCASGLSGQPAEGFRADRLALAVWCAAKRKPGYTATSTLAHVSSAFWCSVSILVIQVGGEVLLRRLFWSFAFVDGEVNRDTDMENAPIGPHPDHSGVSTALTSTQQ